MKKHLFLGLTALLFAALANAAVKSMPIEYKHGKQVLEGYLAFDDESESQRPGVLVVHEWWGINDFVKNRTEELAKMGYVAFAVDMYGKGVRATGPKEAGRLAGIYKGDRALMRARAARGLEILKSHKFTDKTRTAAIGFCFGGTTALELARSGADVRGVVSFHGGLDTPTPDDAKNIKGKVLALHGGDDPYVPEEDVKKFQDEMRKANVDWQFVAYGGAVHSFTNPDAGTDNAKGAAYNEKAATRGWKAMRVFFDEIFK